MDEIVEKNISKLEGIGFVRRFLYLIRKNVLLIILICVMAIAGGVAFIFLSKPSYTATSKVTYTAVNLAAKKEHEKYIEEKDFNPSIRDVNVVTNSINSMNLYKATVMDFCSSAVVVDRATYYYSWFLTEKEKNPNLTINEYVSALNIYEKAIEDNVDYKTQMKNYFEQSINYLDYTKSTATPSLEDYIVKMIRQNAYLLFGDYTYYMQQENFFTKNSDYVDKIGDYMESFEMFKNHESYSPEKVPKTSFINQNVISVISDEGEGEKSNYYFSISYIDGDINAVADKLGTVIYAYNREINSGLVEEGKTEKEQYFGGVEITIKQYSDPVITSTMSKTRVLLIAIVIGIFLSICVIYLKEIFDTTVKDRKELESITGTNVMTYLTNKGE